MATECPLTDWNKSEAGRTYFRVWTKANQEKVRRNHYRSRLKRAYGISPEEFWEIVKAQNHKCPVCSETLVPPGKGHQLNGNGMNVDHDHESGRVRGILCARCNRGLGQFRDSISLLEAAISYLRSNLEQ